MADEPSFDDLMARLRLDEADAAEAIFRRYAGRLIALAQSRLDARLRQKVDAEEVANSALKSFFARQAEGQYDLDDWDSLWSLLTVITLRKCGHRVRHFHAAQRDARREIPGGADADDGPVWEAIAREPTPHEAAELDETVEGLYRGLDEADRRVLEMSLQGYKPDEVAAEVGVARRTVYRVLERVKGRLMRQMEAGHSEPGRP